MTRIPFHPRSLLLLAIADLDLLGFPPDLSRVEAALRGGVTMVQLRGKGHDARSLFEAAELLLAVCTTAGVPLLVNDRPDVALSTGARGAHVGPGDLPPGAARAILGEGILGVSARDSARVSVAEAAAADYLGIGAFRGTSTKPEAEVLGPERICALARSTTIPTVAIGGIRPGDAPLLREGGLAGMAVLGGIFAAEDPEGAARAYCEAWAQG